MPQPADPARPFARVAAWAAPVALAFVVRVAGLGHTDLAPREILFARAASPPASPWSAAMAAWRDDADAGVTPAAALVGNAAWWVVRPFAAELPRRAAPLRLPSVLLGSLAAGLVYGAGRRLASGRVGVSASLLLACSFAAVVASRDAGPSAMTLCAMAAALRCFAEAAAGTAPDRAWRRGFGAAVLLMVALEPGAWAGALGLLAGLLVLTAGRQGAERRALRPWAMLASIAAAAGGLAWALGPEAAAPGGGPGWPVALLGMLFWGRPWFALAAALLMAGAGAFVCLRARGTAAFLVAAGAALATVMVSGMSSPRSGGWVAVLAPMMCLLSAFGLETIAGRDRGANGAWRIGLLLALLLVVPGSWYLPSLYALPAKAHDYGAVARWMESALRPGTPYLLEHPGEADFLEKQGRTPRHPGAVPDAGGPSCGDVQRQREGLKAFAAQFPEAPFVRCARDGRDPVSRCGEWSWPSEFYRQRVDLTNDVLGQLMAWGVWPALAEGWTDPRCLTARVLFNTPADVEAWTRATGAPVQLLYDQWVCGPARPGVYARVRPRAWGDVDVRSFRDGSQRGQFRLRGVLADDGDAVPLELRWMGQTLGVTNIAARAPFEFLTGQVVVPRRGGRFSWGVAGREADAPGLLVLLHLEFVPSPGP